MVARLNYAPAGVSFGNLDYIAPLSTQRKSSQQDRTKETARHVLNVIPDVAECQYGGISPANQGLTECAQGGAMRRRVAGANSEDASLP